MKHKWIKKAAALFAAAALMFSQAAVCMAVDLTPNPPATIQDAWYTGSGDSQTQFSIQYGENGLNSTLLTYNGGNTNVSIPYVVEEYAGSNQEYTICQITTIASTAFTSKSTTQNTCRVTIPDSVTTIEAGAFSANSLRAVWVPKSVVNIGTGAFIKADAGSVKITIYGYANSYAQTYAAANNLSFVAVSDAFTIQNGALVSMSNNPPVDTTGKLTLPEIIFELGFCNFRAENVLSFTVHQSLGMMGSLSSGFFTNFPNLQEFVEDSNPNPLYQIVNGVLYSADGVTGEKILYAYPCGKTDTSYAIPEGTTTLQRWSLRQNQYLQSVSIPSTMTRIADGALVNLKSVSVAETNTVFTMINGVLYGPSGYDDGNNPAVGVLYCAQNENQSALSIAGTVNGKTVTFIAEDVFFRHPYLRSVIVPEGITRIGGAAFGSCPLLSWIDLPSTVTSIQDSAFSGCKNLQGFSVSSKNTAYQSINGVLFTADGSKLLTYPAGKTVQDDSYAIPAGVTEIARCAFQGCRSLREIILPEGLKVIGDGSFMSCESLMQVVLPSSLVDIQPYAFCDCTALSSVVFSAQSSLQSIGRAAFDGCNRLLTISVPDSVTTITRVETAMNLRPFPSGTRVIASQGSVMWQDDTNTGGKFGGSLLYLPGETIPGDVNGDEQINLQDYQLLQDYLTDHGQVTVTDGADVNSDGTADQRDLAVLESLITG